MANESAKIEVFEVGPRDGLQNESIILPVEQKVALIHKLVAAGLKNVEIGSFVHPKWVPQMADTGTVARTIERVDGVNYWGLVPNIKGLERALDCGVTHVAVFMSSSETHNQRNVNRTIDESLEGLSAVITSAKSAGATIRGYISTVFGCPYEGDIDFDRVIEIGNHLLGFGVDELSLGDTTGMGQPEQVRAGAKRAIAEWGPEQVALHLHDTHGLGVTNAYAGYLEGMRKFDSSVGGLGGCPYAPGAPGNLGTEDLLNLMHAMHLDTGVELNEVRNTSRWLESAVGFNLSGRLHV